MFHRVTKSDVPYVAELLRSMYKETFTDAKDDIELYIKSIYSILEDSKRFMFVDDMYKAFYTVLVDNDPLRETTVYQPYQLYIKPEYRKTNILSKIYRHYFSTFRDGDTYIIVEANSEHQRVLAKRYELVSQLYKVGKDNKWLQER